MSGDGPNNAGVPVVPVRDELVGQGIVINGLPIMLKLATGFFDLADLDRYYADCVIGGTGAFMIPIKEKSEFQTATRRKLLLEIAGREPPARLIRVQAPAEPERLHGRRAPVAPLHGRPVPELSTGGGPRSGSQHRRDQTRYALESVPAGPDIVGHWTRLRHERFDPRLHGPHLACRVDHAADLEIEKHAA